MNYRAGIASDHSWYVEQSPDGIHAEVIATRLPSAKSARCFIDAREGRLRPTRSADDVTPASSAVPGDGPVPLGHADAPSGATPGGVLMSARASARG